MAVSGLVRGLEWAGGSGVWFLKNVMAGPEEVGSGWSIGDRCLIGYVLGCWEKGTGKRSALVGHGEVFLQCRLAGLGIVT